MRSRPPTLAVLVPVLAGGAAGGQEAIGDLKADDSPV